MFFRNVLFIFLTILSFFIGFSFNKNTQREKLDSYYTNRFKMIKKEMLKNQSIDSKGGISRYHDITELCMHLDGYNGLEIMEIRIKSLIDDSN